MSFDRPAPDYGRHFGDLAARYDRLRPGPSDRLIETLAHEGELRGRRVLDIGCGTGRVAAALAGRYAATVSGVDPSPEMLEVARGRVPGGVVALELGTAESLPFKDGSFEGAVMQLVVHLVDRPRAFAEAYRVLVPQGRLVISTVNPAALDEIWLSRVFPSYVTIDRGRFPTPDALAADLEEAGFAEIRSVPRRERRSYGRREALRALRGRFTSSTALMSDEEYRAGLQRAERELPESIESVLELAILTARRRATS